MLTELICDNPLKFFVTNDSIADTGGRSVHFEYASDVWCVLCRKTTLNEHRKVATRCSSGLSSWVHSK